MKKQAKFKITFEARKSIMAAIKDLPSIPYLIPGNTGVPVAQQIKRCTPVSGATLLAKDPDLKINGKPVVKDKMYIEQGVEVRMQNHQVALMDAYQKYGEIAITEYCKQVWDHYYHLQTLPPEPKPLDLILE